MMCVLCDFFFFNFCVSSVSCTSVPLCLLPAEMSGWSWLLVQRAPPAANEVKLHLHAPRLAMCLHACRTLGPSQRVVSADMQLCDPDHSCVVLPVAAAEKTQCLWVALTPLSLSALTPR